MTAMTVPLFFLKIQKDRPRAPMSHLWRWVFERMVGMIFVANLSNEKKPGCLGYRGDYTTQLCRVYILNHDEDPY